MLLDDIVFEFIVVLELKGDKTKEITGIIYVINYLTKRYSLSWEDPQLTRIWFFSYMRQRLLLNSSSVILSCLTGS